MIVNVKNKTNDQLDVRVNTCQSTQQQKELGRQVTGRQVMPVSTMYVASYAHRQSACVQNTVSMPFSRGNTENVGSTF